jgi:hypothetical protein
MGKLEGQPFCPLVKEPPFPTSWEPEVREFREFLLIGDTEKTTTLQ